MTSKREDGLIVKPKDPPIIVIRIESTSFEDVVLTDDICDLIDILAEAINGMDPKDHIHNALSIRLALIDPSEFEALEDVKVLK